MQNKPLNQIFIMLIAICFAIPSYSADWNVDNRVPDVGNIIVKRNSLPPILKFELVDSYPNNRYAISSNTIQINKFEIRDAADDNELAYIISRELGEIIVKNLTPKEKNCDDEDTSAMGVDLMINGGYNPLASVSLLEKTNNQDKAEYLFDYISYNYPSKIAAGYNNKDYIIFLANIRPQINRLKANKRKLAKYNKKQAKLSKIRFKKLAKYDPGKSQLSSWQITRELIQSITEPEER